ncbi:MAG: GNAT family N-acetyltransferase [Thermoguttaceae bacterium]|jgi:GNAT superfamily N-acetyltransferase
MEIRPAIIEDAEEILTLQRLAYQSEAAIYDDFTIPPLTETLEDLKARFHDRQFLKAVARDQIVGSVRAFQDGASCHVERLIVRPQYRRQGIATALLNRIETLFPAAQRFELFTGHKSESNIRLYERMGYRTMRQEKVNEKVTLVFMEKTIRVREFHPGDEAAFRRLNEEWLTKYFCIEEKDRKVLGDPCQYILATGGMIFMVELDGKPVGCCALIHKDDETFEVGKMAVTHSHQGKGLGKMLLQTCIEKAKALGKKRLVLETNNVLGTAVALYRKFGFVELGRDVAPLSAYARTEMFMELRLPS